MGVIARAGFALGTVSYYQPFEPAVRGIVSAVPQDLGIRSVAFSTPEEHSYSLRAIALSAGEPGRPARTLGIFARYTISPKAQIVVETARGRRQSDRGDALRASVTGTIAGTTYGASVSRVDPGFVNPANPGLTAGINDRFDTALSVGRAFGKATFSLTTSRHEQGRASTSKQARGANTDGTLTMTVSFTERVSLTASANAGRTSTEAKETLPRANVLQSSGTATLSETVAGVAFSEGFSLLRRNDRVDAVGDQTVQTADLRATRALANAIALTAQASYTRTKSAPLLGVSGAWTVSLNPTFAARRQFVAFRPSIAVSGATNDVTGMSTRSETYGAALDIQPPWLLSLVSGQIGGQVSRSMSAGLAKVSSESRSATASLTFHLKKMRGMPMFATPQN